MGSNIEKLLKEVAKNNELKSNTFGGVIKDNASEEKTQDYSIIEKLEFIKKDTDQIEECFGNELFKNNVELEERVLKLENENIYLKSRIEEIEKFINKWANSRKVTKEQINQIRDLINLGKTEIEIVELTNTSKGTVWRVKNNMI